MISFLVSIPGNRFEHSRLDRYLAKDLLDFVRYGTLPAKFSVEQQKSFLKPLIQILELAGWQTQYKADTPAIVTSPTGRIINLYSYPSLVRTEYYHSAPLSNDQAYSPYELSRDLPGAFKRLQ